MVIPQKKATRWNTNTIVSQTPQRVKGEDLYMKDFNLTLSMSFWKGIDPTNKQNRSELVECRVYVIVALSFNEDGL